MRPGRDINHAHPSRAEVKETVKLYLCSSAGLSRTVEGRFAIVQFTDRVVVVLLNCRVAVFVYFVLGQAPLLEFEKK